MADWFVLQVLLPLVLLLSVLLVVLVPGLRSYVLSCSRRRRRRRRSLTEADPEGRLGEMCSSTPLDRVIRSSRYHRDKLFIPSLEGLETLESQHRMDLTSEQAECQDTVYTLGEETLHNLFSQLPDVSRSFVVEETEETEGCEVLEKCIQDETISDSMVNITFLC